MSGISNFQDVVVLSSDTLSMGIERLILGSDANSKSIVFAQDPALASALHLVASNPTAARTAILPDANGTIALIPSVSAGTTAITNGQIVFTNSNQFTFGINGSTITAKLSTLSAIEVGHNFNTSADNIIVSGSFTTNVHTQTISQSTHISAVRFSVEYPLAITYIDPRAQATLSIQASNFSSSATISGSATWWCGIYTFNGSTAVVVSSTSASTSLSGSSAGNIVNTTISVDLRFTGITWNITPGDYMFFSGASIKASGSFTGATTTASLGISISSTLQGLGSIAEVSYSLPYWYDGSVNTSATSYHLSQISNSGGTGSTATFRPYIRLIGS